MNDGWNQAAEFRAEVLISPMALALGTLPAYLNPKT